MAGTMKEIAENNEKLHRLQMINMILRNMSSYVDDVVSRLEDEFDDCEDFEEYNGEAVYFKSKTMPGNSVLSNCTMTDLIYDDIHLSCMALHPSGFITKKFAYRIVL